MKFIANYIERFTFEAKDVILSLIVRCEVITGYCSAHILTLLDANANRKLGKSCNFTNSE